MVSERVYQGNGPRRRPAVSAKSVKKSQAAGKSAVIAVGSIDYTAFLVVTLLLLIGVIMVFSAGFYKAANTYNDIYYFLKKQTQFAVMGFIIMIFMSSFNYRYLMKFAAPLYLTTNVLLIIVAIFAVATKGARRWIELPVIGRFQPSELAKIAIILMIPFVLHKNKNILKKWPGFLIVLGLVGITAALALLGSLSMAIIIGAIGIGIIFVASPHILRFVVALAAGGGGVAVFIVFFSEGFRFERIKAWLDPFADQKGVGYQIVQSLFAIASGGPFGIGIGQSRQKSFVPEPHNDFIFSIICEELGFVGAGLILALYGILIWRGIRIAMKATDLFGSLAATGIVFMIACQVLINVAVVTNSIPNTGVTLPFISYGGTSLLVTMFLMGILLNISRYTKE